jgi:hypothetical protein
MNCDPGNRKREEERPEEMRMGRGNREMSEGYGRTLFYIWVKCGKNKHESICQ